jgi:hypothetical protein
MKINGVNGHRMAVVHPDAPYSIHLLSNRLFEAECGAPVSQFDGWLVIVVVDDTHAICDDCVVGRQLRRLSAHREVDAARLGDRLLRELRVEHRRRASAK